MSANKKYTSGSSSRPADGEGSEMKNTPQQTVGVTQRAIDRQREKNRQDAVIDSRNRREQILKNRREIQKKNEQNLIKQVKENFKTGTPIGSYPLQKSISGDKIKYGLLDTSKVKRGK